MKFARMLLIFALAGLVTMDAVSAQKDDKEVDDADAVEDDADDEEDDDFFVDVPIDGTTPAPVVDEFDEEDNAAMGPDGGPPDMDAVPPPVVDEELISNSVDCVDAPVDADCTECLEAGCVLAAGSCIIGCEFIADTSCWDAGSMGFVNNTIEEICDMATAAEEDAEICGGEDLTDCETCTSTVKSDGESACSWYVDGEMSYCGVGGCGMMGVCPVETCDAEEEIAIDTPPVDEVEPPVEEVDPPMEESTPCQQFPECEPCLNNRMGPGCVWIGDSCQDSCDAIMDAACYSAAIFPNTTGPEICAMAAEPVDGPTDGGMMTDEETPMADMDTDAPTEAEADGDRSTVADEAVSAAFSGKFVGAAVAALSALSMVMA